MGQFKINNDIATKTIRAEFEGIISAAEAVDFINKFKRAVGAVNASQYSFVLECSKLKIGDKESVSKLEDCFKLYKQLGFKHMTFNVGSNSILSLQIKRLSKAIDLSNYEIK